MSHEGLVLVTNIITTNKLLHQRCTQQSRLLEWDLGSCARIKCPPVDEFVSEHDITSTFFDKKRQTGIHKFYFVQHKLQL